MFIALPLNGMTKILIVDDQPSIRELLSHLLRKVSIVMTSHSLDDARTALLNHKFDLVISDLILDRPNGREGLELLSHIREVSPDTKVIIMSGYGTKAVKDEAFRLGAESFIEKPINISHLVSKVRSLNSR
jgi:DNA-binding NtrC family response regulator